MQIDLVSTATSPWNVVPWLALFVSFLAFALTIYQAWAARRHNRLTVRPYLRLGWKVDSDRHGIWVRNLGYGPAVVETFSLSKNGAEISQSSLQNELRAIVHGARANIFTKGAVLGADKEAWIIWYDGPLNDQEKLEAFWKVLAGHKISFTVTSLYKERQARIDYVVPDPISEKLIDYTVKTVTPADSTTASVS